MLDLRGIARLLRKDPLIDVRDLQRRPQMREPVWRPDLAARRHTFKHARSVRGEFVPLAIFWAEPSQAPLPFPRVEVDGRGSTQDIGLGVAGEVARGEPC